MVGQRAAPTADRGSTADRERLAHQRAAPANQRAARAAGAQPVSVDQAGDPRVRGKVAAPRRDVGAQRADGAARRGRLPRRPPRYVYRLAELDELLTDAEVRADAEVEMRRDAVHRRTNRRFVGVIAVVAAGIGVVAAGLINEVVSVVMRMFSM
jgi:hypothetical protein